MAPIIPIVKAIIFNAFIYNNPLVSSIVNSLNNLKTIYNLPQKRENYSHIKKFF